MREGDGAVTTLFRLFLPGRGQCCVHVRESVSVLRPFVSDPFI